MTRTNLGADAWALLQQAGTNDFLTLKELASPAFDPWQTVLLAESPAVPNPPAAATNGNSGTVEFTSYAPTDIKFHTQAATPTVLLLNDQYDPNWRVTVDGKPAPLLRANFIMRGVYLTAGRTQCRIPIQPAGQTALRDDFGHGRWNSSVRRPDFSDSQTSNSHQISKSE